MGTTIFSDRLLAALRSSRRSLQVSPILAHEQYARSISQEASALTAYFKSAELRTQQPWRKQYEHYQALIKDWEATPLETLREVFTDKAKNGLPQPSEVMLGIYLLYGGERELDFLRRLRDHCVQ